MSSDPTWRMKRDMDLVRDLLFELEGHDDLIGMQTPEPPNRTPQEVAYHLGLLAEAGLIEAVAIRNMYGPGWAPTSITWAGHEFIDSARSNENWQKAKSLAKVKGGALTFEAIRTALSEMTKRAIVYAINSV